MTEGTSCSSRTMYCIYGTMLVTIGWSDSSTATDDMLEAGKFPYGFVQAATRRRHEEEAITARAKKLGKQLAESLAANGDDSHLPFQRIDPLLQSCVYDRHEADTLYPYRANYDFLDTYNPRGPSITWGQSPGEVSAARTWLFLLMMETGKNSKYDVDFRLGTSLVLNGKRYLTRRTERCGFRGHHVNAANLAKRLAFLEMLYVKPDFTTFYVNMEELEAVEEGTRKTFTVAHVPNNKYYKRPYVGLFMKPIDLFEDYLL